MKNKKKIKILMPYSDSSGSVYDYPGIDAVFRSGRNFYKPEIKDLIKLPYGSYLFNLPDRIPVGFDGNKIIEIHEDVYRNKILPVSSFLASAYLRTYLPAYKNKEDHKRLTLWAYAGAAIINGKFYTPAIRIDDDIRSDPQIHENHEELKNKIDSTVNEYKKNRLIKQLAKCSTEYSCLCARNFFLSDLKHLYRHHLPAMLIVRDACRTRIFHQDLLHLTAGWISHQPLKKSQR